MPAFINPRPATHANASLPDAPGASPVAGFGTTVPWLTQLRALRAEALAKPMVPKASEREREWTAVLKSIKGRSAPYAQGG